MFVHEYCRVENQQQCQEKNQDNLVVVGEEAADFELPVIFLCSVGIARCVTWLCDFKSTHPLQGMTRSPSDHRM